MNAIFGSKENSLIEMTLGQLMNRVAEVYPDTDGLVYIDRPFRKTWKELNEECDNVARGLIAAGIKKGDKVAIWATNYPEWVVTMFATAKVGGILVTVNTNYKVFEAQYLLKQSDASTLIMMDGFKDSSYVEIINELCPTLKESKPGELNSKEYPFLKRVIYIDKKENTPAGMYHWDDIKLMAQQVSKEELDVIQNDQSTHDVTNMQYTSGTTGFPKGVMLTHFNILNNGKSIGDCQVFTNKDRLCIPVPFFHCFGCVLAIMACVTHGTTMVPVESYSPVRVMETIQKEKCTATYGVPTMYIAILEHADFKKYDYSSLRTGIMSGSPCPVKVMNKVLNEMHMPQITIPYGQTENSPVCTMTTIEDSIEKRVSTVGKKMPFMDVKIIDPETRADLPIHTQGEIVIKGYSVMRGYYKMPEATAQAVDQDGWLHTGDLGTMDEDGYFNITGRIKDMIIRGGENIYPKEIEEFLYTHPQISDVQVIGVPSKEYGEQICACVILAAGEICTEADIKEYVKSHMARHKTPSFVLFMDSFPMTASGKIQKFKMREAAIDSLKLHEAAGIVTA